MLRAAPLARCGALLAALGACGADRAPPADPGAVYLSPTEHLVRASMALRGIRPSLAELRAVDADPGALPALVDDYLASPELGPTIRELHDDALHLRIQLRGFTMPAYTPLEGRSFLEVAESLYSEPLRLIEHVVTTGRPYTEIVTADYTVANDVVAAIFGLEHPGGPAWVPTSYDDDRGAGGILATSSLHLRYRSTGMNDNRTRAAVLARALLCHDFATSDIELDTRVDLADRDAVAAAIRSNPSCVGCHQALDPLASYFFAFQKDVFFPSLAVYPIRQVFTKANEGNWSTATGRPPSYFGAAAEGLTGLGRAIAADPRFARCTARRFAAYLTQQRPEAIDPRWLTTLQERFVASGFDARRLLRDIVLSDQLRLASHADPALAEGIVGYQKARPAQYARMLHDLTGDRWRVESPIPPPGELWPRLGTVEMLDDDLVGYRVLMGGMDGMFVTQPVHTMTATASLVASEAALHAAAHVVAHDAASAPGERHLLVAAPVLATDEESARAQLGHLHARVFGVLHEPDVEPELALLRAALAASGDPQRAWTVTLAGMLSDLRAVYY